MNFIGIKISFHIFPFRKICFHIFSFRKPNGKPFRTLMLVPWAGKNPIFFLLKKYFHMTGRNLPLLLSSNNIGKKYFLRGKLFAEIFSPKSKVQIVQNQSPNRRVHANLTANGQVLTQRRVLLCAPVRRARTCE